MRGAAPTHLLVAALAASIVATSSCAGAPTSGPGTTEIVAGTAPKIDGSGTAPPPAWSAQTVDVEGVPIMVRCAGDGPKTVVFVSNLGEDGVTGWQASGVPDRIATLTRTCTYDRPGLGASGPSPDVRSVTNQVAELGSLVNAKALPTPIVLVGHRYGTFIARQYAHDHLREMAGLVLVDPPLELLDPTPPGPLTPGQQAEQDTIEAIDADLGAFGAGKLPPPPAPTIVLGAGDLAPLPATVPAGGPTVATATSKQPAEPGDLRRSGQSQLARKSPFGSFRAIEDSGSYVQYWAPEAVINAITTVLNDPRSPQG